MSSVCRKARQQDLKLFFGGSPRQDGDWPPLLFPVFPHPTSCLIAPFPLQISTPICFKATSFSVLSVYVLNFHDK